MRVMCCNERKQLPTCWIFHSRHACIYYIYTALKYLNRWAMSLNPEVNCYKECIAFVCQQPQPPFCSSLSAALTASWNNDWEECYWAQKVMEGVAHSVPALSPTSLLYNHVWLGLEKCMNTEIRQYVSCPSEKQWMLDSVSGNSGGKK